MCRSLHAMFRDLKLWLNRNIYFLNPLRIKVRRCVCCNSVVSFLIYTEIHKPRETWILAIKVDIVSGLQKGEIIIFICVCLHVCHATPVWISDSLSEPPHSENSGPTPALRLITTYPLYIYCTANKHIVIGWMKVQNPPSLVPAFKNVKLFLHFSFKFMISVQCNISILYSSPIRQNTSSSFS